MNLHDFKTVRKIFLLKEASMTLQSIENLSETEKQAVYEFLSEKYSAEQSLNEGLVSSIVSWFRRNFSPRAARIKKFGKQYYDWLMAEYNASYKKNDEDTPLDTFLKKEKVSSDIEQQINDEAGDSEDYKELAKRIVLENKIRAKKDFSKKILGADADLTRRYSSEEAAASEDVRRAMNDLSREDTKQFEFNLKTLRERIRKDGKKNEMASKLAAGIMVFAQNRKLAQFRDYSPEELWKEYERGEKIYLSVTKEMNNMKGAEYMFSIRASRDPDLLKVTRLLAKQIKEEVEKINQLLLDVGVDVSKHWGLVELFLKQRDPESQQKVLDIIRERVKEMSDNEKEDLSSKVEQSLNDIALQSHEPEREDSEVDRVEDSLRGERDSQQTDSPETEEPSQEPQASTEEPTTEPAEEYGPVAKKLIESLQADADPVLEGMKDYIIALSTAIEKGHGADSKFVWNPVAKATETATKSGLNDPNNGIDPVLVEQAKKYVKNLNSENPFQSEFDEPLMKEAAEALFSDFKKGLKIWNEGVEKSDEETQKELVSKTFFATLFKDKMGNSNPLSDEQVKEYMTDSFTFYV